MNKSPYVPIFGNLADIELLKRGRYKVSKICIFCEQIFQGYEEEENCDDC